VTRSFHPEADEEFQEAIQYYEGCEPGLGADFYSEVCSALGRISQFPQAWPVLDGEVRRGLVNRFPYGVLYSIEEDGIFVLAVMLLRRDPEYWRRRV